MQGSMTGYMQRWGKSPLVVCVWEEGEGGGGGGGWRGGFLHGEKHEIKQQRK